MTLEQIQALTDDEIREKVAELCGWKGPHMQYSGPYVGLVGDAPDGARSRPVPNYPADLNACAEMESVMTRAQLWLFDDYMLQICGDALMVKHATARQRCNAFLATMGKDTP